MSRKPWSKKFMGIALETGLGRAPSLRVMNLVKEQSYFLYMYPTHHGPLLASKLLGLLIRLYQYQRPDKNKKEMPVPDSAVLSLSLGVRKSPWKWDILIHLTWPFWSKHVEILWIMALLKGVERIRYSRPGRDILGTHTIVISNVSKDGQLARGPSLNCTLSTRPR